MSLKYAARKVMAFARNPSKLVTMIYEELTRLDVRVRATETRTEVIRIPADATAGATWEIALGHAMITGRIASAQIVPDSDIGQATDYMKLSLINKLNTGEGTTVLGSRNVNSTKTLDAFLGANIIETIPDVDVAHALALKKEVEGEGQSWPGGVIEITYIPSA
jgi:hypothetical protein